jgi:hypothetical protein
MTIFGYFKDGARVEEAVQSFLKRWLPVYLAEVADQNGLPRDSYQMIKSWTNSPEFDLDETTALPAALILSTGIDPSSIIREGDGRYTVSWIIGIAVVVSAKDQESTNRLAKRYGAAIRGLLLQQRAMETDDLRVLSWDDEGYDDIPSNQRRTLASVRLVFTIEQQGTMGDNDGPVLPPDPPPDPTQPYQDWPTLADSQHVYVNVERSDTP